MLSIGKLTPGRADYYVEQLPDRADEYYLGGEREGDARWLGSAVDRLGLADTEVTPEVFRNLLDARHPLTGAPLGVPGTTDRRVAGFDLCFSAPKSVSAAWGLAQPSTAEMITAAHRHAVEAGIQAMEVEAVRARRGAGGHRLVDTSGVVASGFEHRSSRAGDPQIHTHVVVANLTADSDGRWTSLYGANIYRWAKTIGHIYQAELRAELSRALGVQWGEVHKGVGELTEVPEALLREFSTRRAQIEAALDETGASSRAARQVASLATRAPKHTVADLDTLRTEWLDRADRLGIDTIYIGEPQTHPQAPGFDVESALAGLVGPDGLTAHQSAFDRRDVLQAVAEHADQGATYTQLGGGAARVLDHDQVVQVADHSHTGRLYSTRDLLVIEADLLARGMRYSTARPVPDAIVDRVLADRPSLSDEQRDMVAGITTTAAAMAVVVGRAGTGKTYALDAARDAWQTAGRPVIGTALAARAAAELQAGTGIPCSTVDQLLTSLDQPGPLSPLGRHAVVVVDEAGMVGTRKLHRLAVHAERADATIVLVGDPRQLPEIEAGGALAALARSGPTWELTANRRQVHGWEQRALDQLRHGSVADAVTAYRDRGRITLAPTAPATRQAMVADWYEARQQGERAVMYALRRSDVDDLNDLARLRLQSAGELGPDQLEAGGRSFAVGDEILCLKNDRGLDVRNGTTGQIAAITPDGRIVLADGRHLTDTYIGDGHVTHGYATTIHKAQGATVDRAFMLGSDTVYREAGYVGMSRARQRSDLYIVTPRQDPNLPEVDPLAQTINNLARSQAQTLATDLEHKPNLPDRRAALVADPPEWAVDTLGSPPATREERSRWADQALRIDTYRHAYQITDHDGLGPQPDDPTQRRAWDLARGSGLDRSRHLDQGIDIDL